MPALLEKPEIKREMVEPFGWFERMRNEIDHLFESTLMRPALRLQAQWMPALEVTEREGEFYIAVDLPGLKKEDVKLEVTPEGLAIKGERKSEKTETAKGYFRSERVYGEFYRFVPLPEGALAENVDARFKDGVLEIHVPVIKPEKPTAKEIAIK